MVNRNSELY